MKIKFRIISLIVSAVLAIGAAAVIFAAGLIPDCLLTYDMTADRLTKISPETEKFLSDIDEDVTIYLLAAEGITDPQFDVQLSRLEKANRHIKVRVVNTTANPDFIKDYTKAELGDYSLVVKSDKRFTVVDSMPFYDYTFSVEGGSSLNMTYAEYTGIYATLKSAFDQAYAYLGNEEQADQYCVSQFQISFTDFCNNTEINEFRGCDGMIAGAIEYVTVDSLPLLYELTGHREQLISEILKNNLILAAGYEMGEKLDLAETGKIPGDASAVFIMNPVDDISRDEAKMLTDYLANGGSVFLATSPDQIGNKPNLLSVAGTLGLDATEGTVCDLGEKCSYQTVKNIIPSYNTENAIGKSLSDMNCVILMPNAHGITVDPLPGVTASAIANTSETSYRVSGGKRVADSDGAYDIAVSAENANGGKLVWFGSSDCFTDACSQISNYNNYYAFMTSVTELADVFEPTIEISYTKSAEAVALSATKGQAAVWMIIIAIAIPLLLCTIAFAVAYRRKHKQ